MTDAAIDNNQSTEQNLSIDDLAAQLSVVEQAEPAEGRTEQPESQVAEGSLQAAEPGAAQETPGADQTAAEGQQAMTVKDLAEKLSVPVESLYGGLTIDVGEGQHYTLGEIKDRAKDLTQADAMLAKAQQQQLETENALLAKRRVLDRAAERMGYQPTEADIAEMQAEAEQYTKLQQQLAVEYMPEWADEGVKATEMKGIQSIQAEYQFSEAEQAAFIDARLQKVFRDFYKLREQVSDAAKRYEKPSRKGQKPATHVQVGNAIDNIRAEVSGGRMSSDDAIGKLAQALE